MKYLIDYIITHRWQIIKFTTVGFLTFGIYFLCFHFFYAFTHLDYRIAVTIAYVITVISHFLCHRLFTFGAAEQKMVHNLWRYFLMLGLNYFITLTVVWFSVNIIKTTPYVGLVISTALTAAANFFVMKHFVFDVRKH